MTSYFELLSTYIFLNFQFQNSLLAAPFYHPCTKRTVLKRTELSIIFKPLGFLWPITLFANYYDATFLDFRFGLGSNTSSRRVMSVE